ncbi:unnamed protein product (macronuclear) [Paramecium tetraurelia]|uniref:protein-tyrosine-phosphatase n=1 Tax=Paramecium tetraurelia TaxID=5888 RepID=A0DTV4_PARTE|nr:uncharacterized protein GSPATT00020154001 [Paramecium tetraurelia]CAK86471.1 unnamed protein product [Paramecium tetraurelia]|eukprot:XP_001453868.1 hypothetical protein (macronuclear) [Paramecium tetraurelia strain d4-2]
MSRFSILSNDMDKVHSVQGTSLWLGSLKAAKNSCLLRQNNIKTVITVANNITLKIENFKHHIFSIEDSTSFRIIDYFQQINEVIDEGLRNGSVLVHCMAGISRSSACVIAYLMQSQGWPYEKTYYYVKEKRLTINPNPGFKKQLIQYSKKLEKLQNTKSSNESTQSSRQLPSPRNIHQSPQDFIMQLIKNNIKSPSRKIEQLDQSSTVEDKEIYRLQLAQKLFAQSLQNNCQKTVQNMSDHFKYNTPPIKMNISNTIDYFSQTDRLF